MEDKSIKKLFTEAKKISLTSEESSVVKNNIMAYVHSHSHLSLDNCDCHCHEEKTCHKGGIFCLNQRFLVFASLALLIGVGASVSMAAQSSLPGDKLYGVKVGINEEIKSYVTFSDEKNARWQIRRLERRAQEAEKLASEMIVSNEANIIIEKQFELQSNRVGEKIAALHQDGKYAVAADISSEFETSMRAHHSVLALLNEANADYQFRVKPFELKLSSILGVATELKKESMSKVTVDTEYPGTQSTVEFEKQSVETLLAEVNALISQSTNIYTKARAELHVNAALSLLNDGKAFITAKEFQKAHIAFEQATWKLREAKIILESSSYLHINSDTTFIPSTAPVPKTNPLEVRVIPEADITQVSEVRIQATATPIIPLPSILTTPSNFLGL
jgi:hypothetical protein